MKNVKSFIEKKKKQKKVVWKTVWKINRNEEKVKVSQIKKINLDKSEKKSLKGKFNLNWIFALTTLQASKQARKK